MSTQKCFRLLVFLVALSIGQAIMTEQSTENADFVWNNSLNNSANEVEEKSFGWLQGAKEMFSSPTGHVVVRVAKELLNRSVGNNQVRSDAVLSLNLTNLIIILLLKVLIFAAGVLGAGHWNGGYGYGYNYHRSSARSENNGLGFGLTNGEDSIVTAFLAAQGSGIDDCLYAAACANPDISSKYTKAARALMEGAKKFDGSALGNPRYNDLITLMEKATYDGLRGLSCNTTADCSGVL